MAKVRKFTAFIACRTTAGIESEVKKLCLENNKSVSDTLNYLLRIFLEDKNSIRSDFFKKSR